MPDPLLTYIAFGGNLGDVQANFISARTAIAELEHTSLIASSYIYCTPPLGPAGQADYLNAVIAIESRLSALKLLDALQHIEQQHQRMRAEHWGPRTLDLDIIAIGNQIIGKQSIATDRLNIPHIEMHKRQFVLRPLCDIAPNWQHPRLLKSASQMLQTLLQHGETALPKGTAW
ncbi:MAG: 2-amino-4-hydroxy-6-hydroxymethyldihydropteridine diphosphokinase [Mariprofundus sp.]|nr:2-amino-4-hydroxy-6-hydroxymethyldihydropteridine diphosphokinase [Mariprofundus sp.]